jgi:nucleotide-binding universal stress UspA family protein
MDIDLLKRLDKAVDRSKEITTIVGKLQSAFYTNDETAIEDYLELARTYSIYSLGELDATIQELLETVQQQAQENVIQFPKQKS